MVESKFQEIQDRFDAMSRGEIMRRLLAELAEGDEYAAAFLRELAPSVDGVADYGELWKLFLALSERYVCGGNNASPGSDLVRVVPAVEFLCYYSKKFVKIEEETRRGRIAAELGKIKVIFSMLSTSNLRLFLDEVLNLSGRLRRFGYPLWLTTKDDVEGCHGFADCAKRLALGDGARESAFRLDIGLHHLGATPNVRRGETDHDPAQTMTVHTPTVVDGMSYKTFVKGGATISGAKEYVSRLDNTDAIDRLEIVE